MSRTIHIDDTTVDLIHELRAHIDTQPKGPDDYMVNVPFLELQMNRWQARHNALSVVIMERLFEEAMSDDD